MCVLHDTRSIGNGRTDSEEWTSSEMQRTMTRSYLVSWLVGSKVEEEVDIDKNVDILGTFSISGLFFGVVLVLVPFVIN